MPRSSRVRRPPVSSDRAQRQRINVMHLLTWLTRLASTIHVSSRCDRLTIDSMIDSNICWVLWRACCDFQCLNRRHANVMSSKCPSQPAFLLTNFTSVCRKTGWQWNGGLRGYNNSNVSIQRHSCHEFTYIYLRLSWLSYPHSNHQRNVLRLQQSLLFAANDKCEISV